VSVGKVLEELTETIEDAAFQPAVAASSDVIQRLVKSVERVRDLGEVFTPFATVRAMLDLIPEEMWQTHPSATFLEPACGDGNFLVGVLERKLANVAQAYGIGALPAGTTTSSLQFHAL
jgi:type I restriction-modification system DNA methylase subunit